ncbi:MAG: ParB/RepB/Spo0J family partition protein [Actinomycetota bacterium]
MRPGLSPEDVVLATAIDPNDETESKWAEHRSGGVTDAVLRSFVVTALQENFAGHAEYDLDLRDGKSVEEATVTWSIEDRQPRLWFGALEPPTDRVPDLEGKPLLARVRSLMGVGKPKRSKPKPAKASPRPDGQSPGEPPFVVESLAVGEVVPAEGNRSWSLADLSDEELAEYERTKASIAANGQQSDCLGWRPPEREGRVELIAGEGRWRICGELGRPVRVKVYEVDRARAVEMRGDENLRRRELTKAERARWYQQMLDAGWTQAALAQREGRSREVITNDLRTLRLPADWLALVSRETVVPWTYARELTAPWITDDVWPALEPLRAEIAAGEIDEFRNVGEFGWALRQAVVAAAHPLSGSFHDRSRGEWGEWVDVAITPAVCRKHADDLRIVEVPRNGKTERYALNVELARELQAAGEEKRAARKSKTAGAKAGAARTPADRKALTERQAVQLEDKLRRYKTAWLQRAIGERLSDPKRRLLCEPIPRSSPRAYRATPLLLKLLLWFATRSDGATSRRERLAPAVEGVNGSAKGVAAISANADVWGWLSSFPADRMGSVAHAVIGWLQEDAFDYRSSLGPGDVATIASELGIDFAAEYSLDEELLSLPTRAQLDAWIKEWKLAKHPAWTAETRDAKTAAIAGVLAVEAAKVTAGENPLPPPKALAKLKV